MCFFFLVKLKQDFAQLFWVSEVAGRSEWMGRRLTGGCVIDRVFPVLSKLHFYYWYHGYHFARWLLAEEELALVITLILDLFLVYAMYIRVTLYCGHLIILWLFHLGISCTVFVLICTVVVLYCFVVCGCVCVCVWVL